MRFSGRVLYVGCIGNVGVYARQHRNIGSCEGNGNDVYIIIVFLNCVGARIARPRAACRRCQLADYGAA